MFLKKTEYTKSRVKSVSRGSIVFLGLSAVSINNYHKSLGNRSRRSNNRLG